MDREKNDVTQTLLNKNDRTPHIVENKSSEEMPQVHLTFDEILEEIGELGKYQITIYVLVCFPVLFGAANSFTYLFAAGETNYRCKVPYCDNNNYSVYNPPWLSNAIPAKSKCEMYQTVPDAEALYNGTCVDSLFEHSQRVHCTDFIYDPNDDYTIMQQWNIVCDEIWKLPLVGTVHFAGIVVGTALFGFLADCFGRKSIFVFCTLLMSISGVLQVISLNYIIFIVLIFINALGTSGVYPLAFIIGVELVGKNKREFTGIALNYFYTIGESLVGVIAWAYNNWIPLQLVVSAPPLLFIAYWWFIPESIRWLLAKRKTQRATETIERVAKSNGVALSEIIKVSLQKESKVIKQTEIWPCAKEMLSSSKIVFRFVFLFYIWTANIFTYYGLNINSVNMAGNKYLNFIVTSLAGIPGYTLALISLKYMGRKSSLFYSLIGCTICSAAVIFVPKGVFWLQTLLYVFAKMFVTSSVGIVFIYTAEMLPTLIRSGGVGVCSTLSRLAAMLAPFIPYIYPQLEYLPMLVFSAISLIAAVLTLFLPETWKTKLPETAAEAIKL